MEALREKPSLRDQQVASASLAHFATLHHTLKTAPSAAVTICLPEQNETVTIPRKALELLEFVLAEMAQGVVY